MISQIQSPLLYDAEVRLPVLPDSPEFQAILDEIASGAAQRELEREHPHCALALLKNARFGALRLPRADGGGGLSFKEFYGTVLRLGAADSNVSHIFRNHFVFVERYLQKPRNEELRRWRQVIAGGAIFGAAVQDIERVQGASGSFTRIQPDGDGYRLNGTKVYSTGCLYADFLQIRIKGDDGIQATLLIPADREGVTLVDDWDGSGQRLTGTGTTRLDNVRVEASEVIFDETEIAFGVPYTSTLPQLYMTAINAGITRNVFQEAKALLQRRVRSFDHGTAKRPTDDPNLLQVIGQLASNAFAAETVVLNTAESLDHLAAVRARGDLATEEAGRTALRAAQAKVTVDDLVLRSATALYDVGGASATRRGYNLDRHWRNARTLASHNPALYKARAIGDYEVNGTPLPSDFF